MLICPLCRLDCQMQGSWPLSCLCPDNTSCVCNSSGCRCHAFRRWSCSTRGEGRAHQLLLRLAFEVLLGTPADVPRLAAQDGLPLRVHTYEETRASSGRFTTWCFHSSRAVLTSSLQSSALVLQSVMQCTFHPSMQLHMQAYVPACPSCILSGGEDPEKAHPWTGRCR